MGNLGALQGVKTTDSTQTNGVYKNKTTTPLNTGKKASSIFDKNSTQGLKGDHYEENDSTLKIDTITKPLYVPRDPIFITKDPSKKARALENEKSFSLKECLKSLYDWLKPRALDDDKNFSLKECLESLYDWATKKYNAYRYGLPEDVTHEHRVGQ